MDSRSPGLQDLRTGHVGVIKATQWLHPGPWAAKAPGEALFQWRFTGVKVTCAQDDGAIRRMAALPVQPLPVSPIHFPGATAESARMCYHAEDRGESYRGQMASSESGAPCLAWGSPGHPAGSNVFSPANFAHMCDPSLNCRLRSFSCGCVV